MLMMKDKILSVSKLDIYFLHLNAVNINKNWI